MGAPGGKPVLPPQSKWAKPPLSWQKVVVEVRVATRRQAQTPEAQATTVSTVVVEPLKY
jgi:hypothetical protein